MYFRKTEPETIATPTQFFKCLQLATELYCCQPSVDVKREIIYRATGSYYSDEQIKIIWSYTNYCRYPYDFLIDAVNAPRDFFSSVRDERIQDFHIALVLAVGDCRCIKGNRQSCKRWCDNAVKRGPIGCEPEVAICDVAGGTRTSFDYSLLDKEQKDS